MFLWRVIDLSCEKCGNQQFLVCPPYNIMAGTIPSFSAGGNTR